MRKSINRMKKYDSDYSPHYAQLTMKTDSGMDDISDKIYSEGEYDIYSLDNIVSDITFKYTDDQRFRYYTRKFENGIRFVVDRDEFDRAIHEALMNDEGHIFSDSHDDSFGNSPYDVRFLNNNAYDISYEILGMSVIEISDDLITNHDSYVENGIKFGVYLQGFITNQQTGNKITSGLGWCWPVVGCSAVVSNELANAPVNETVEFGDQRFEGWPMNKSTNRMKKADFTTVKILEDSGIVTDYRIMENEYYPTFSVDVMYTYVTDEGEELTRLFKNGGTIITDFYDFNDALDASLASGVMYYNGESVVPVDFEVTRAYISEIRGYWIEGLDRVPSGTDAIDCDVFIEADLRLVDSDEKEYAVSDTLVMYNPIFKPEVELRYALIMEETIRMSDPRFQGWENLSKSSVRKTNRIRKSTTPIVFEHNNRMFGLDIDFDIGDDDGPWEAIGRFDDTHGTDFWDRITEDMLIPSYIDVKDITYVNTWDDVLSFSDELEKNPMRKSASAVHADHNGRKIPLTGTVADLVKIMGRK